MKELIKVSLREKKISGGKLSLYLDYYPPICIPGTKKTTRREFLNIYIYENPKNTNEKRHNTQMRFEAESIRQSREKSTKGNDFDFLESRKIKINFLEYFRKKAIRKDQKWQKTYKHFEIFTNGECFLDEVNLDLCNAFKAYLLTANKLARENTRLSHNSAASYFSTFRALLRIAYFEKLLTEDINPFIEKRKTKDVKRDFLTLDELHVLVKTPCDIPVLKSASLFSCLTGLRISDILELSWENIIKSHDNGYYVRIITIKTGKQIILPINNEALELCGERSIGKIFKGLSKSMTHFPLKKWILQAGITKNITFNCLRHNPFSFSLKINQLQEIVIEQVTI